MGIVVTRARVLGIGIALLCCHTSDRAIVMTVIGASDA
jgi:hypothetical protein